MKCFFCLLKKLLARTQVLRIKLAHSLPWRMKIWNFQFFGSTSGKHSLALALFPSFFLFLSSSCSSSLSSVPTFLFFFLPIKLHAIARYSASIRMKKKSISFFVLIFFYLLSNRRESSGANFIIPYHECFTLRVRMHFKCYSAKSDYFSSLTAQKSKPRSITSTYRWFLFSFHSNYRPQIEQYNVRQFPQDFLSIFLLFCLFFNWVCSLWFATDLLWLFQCA